MFWFVLSVSFVCLMICSLNDLTVDLKFDLVFALSLGQDEYDDACEPLQFTHLRFFDVQFIGWQFPAHLTHV